jgi:hypothetical protein
MHFETAGQPVGRAARVGAGAAARARRTRRRSVGHLRLRRQQPRRIDGRHRSGNADPHRLRQHGSALHRSEHGAAAQRTFRFRHTGNLNAKFAEARQVLGMTINYQARFKELADHVALQPITEQAFERRVLCHLWPTDQDMGIRARANRQRTIESVLAIFRGRGSAADTTGNSPGSKWVAWNSVCEHVDYGRRYTSRTNQVQRSFEDTSLKQRALDLVLAS